MFLQKFDNIMVFVIYCISKRLYDKPRIITIYTYISSKKICKLNMMTS